MTHKRSAHATENTVTHPDAGSASIVGKGQQESRTASSAGSRSRLGRCGCRTYWVALRVTRSKASKRGSTASAIMAISRSGIRLALTRSRHPDKDVATCPTRSNTPTCFSPQSSARARSPSTSPGIATAPIIDVEQSWSCAGVGFTSNAGLSPQKRRSPRTPPRATVSARPADIAVERIDGINDPIEHADDPITSHATQSLRRRQQPHLPLWFLHSP